MILIFMKKVMCLFIGYLLCCCTTLKNDCINYEIAQKETLVKVYAKIITSGSIEFLRYENGYYRLSVYSYRLDMKNKTPYCTLRKDTLYKADDLFNICREGNWMTSSIFKQYGNYDPYFRCFSEDFLELSNDKKIEVLNEISKRRILQGH